MVFTKFAVEPGLPKPKGRGEKLGVASWIVSGANRKVDSEDLAALLGSLVTKTIYRC
jgi:uncharacterized protein YidB (DUF937 family)